VLPLIGNILTLVMSSLILTVIQLLFFGVLCGSAGLFIAKQYLENQAKNRKREIEMLLPDVVAFMYCQSVGGMNRLDIIREVANAEDTYGEVSTEFSRVIHYMDTFNEDPNTAIGRVAESTPSDSLSEFFNDLLSTITSGGQMDTFLEAQLNKFLAEVEQAQEAELDKLELFNEVYITISLFPVIALILVGIAGGMGYIGIDILLINVYVAVPIVQIVALTVTAALFTNEYGAGELKPDVDDAFNYISDDAYTIFSTGIAEKYKGEGKIFDQIYVNERYDRVVSFLSNPPKYMYQNPQYTFWFSVPTAIVFVVGAVLTGDFGVAPKVWTSTPFQTTLVSIYIPILIVGIPYTIAYELNQYKYGKITDGLTTDLNKLANTNEQGTTLRQSILITAQSGTSQLSKEFERIYKKQEYGTPLGQAIIEVNNKYKIPRLARVFRIIKSAQEVSTNITEVLKTAANLSAAQDEIEKERINRTRQQIGVIVIIFIVFLVSVVMMQEILLSSIVSSQTIGSAGLLQAGGEPIPLDTIGLLFYHAGIIHGGLSGFLAGYIQTGEYPPGAKYSLGMISLVMFVWFVVLSLL
jgi:flagellar protein FlaJ